MQSLKDWLARKPKGSAPKRPLPRVTPKRAKQNREYSVRRKAFLETFMVCNAGIMFEHFKTPNKDCTMLATDVHHMKGRLGGNFLDESTWLPVCRSCHNRIHAQGNIARALGLLH